MGKTVTVVEFEPDWVAVYVDGELYGDGHHYQLARLLKELLTEDYDVSEVNGEWFDPETWKGTPDTLSEVGEVYGNVD
jgi:hypothetical protein